MRASVQHAPVLTHSKLSRRHTIVLSDGQSPYEDAERRHRRRGQDVAHLDHVDRQRAFLRTADVPTVIEIFEKEIAEITKAK